MTCKVKGIDYQVSFFPSVHGLPEEWNYIANLGSTFVQRRYLKALEAAPPTDMKFGYLLFYKNNPFYEHQR